MSMNDRSLRSLTGNLIDDITRLIRQELRLAQVEAGEKASQIQTGVISIAAGMLLALAALLILLQALVLDQKVASVPRFKADVAKGAYSVRVQNNVERAVASAKALFNGKTIPEEHRLTAYGLHMAGVEYLDHVRKAQSDATRVGRSLLRDEPAKARLSSLVREVVANQ